MIYWQKENIVVYLCFASLVIIYPVQSTLIIFLVVLINKMYLEIIQIFKITYIVSVSALTNYKIVHYLYFMFIVYIV